MNPQPCNDRPAIRAETHEVFNQTPPLQAYNVFDSDATLQEGVVREGAAWALDDLKRYGETCGCPEAIELGFLANEYPPQLDTHDRAGHRIDRVRYHPSYHQLILAFAHFFIIITDLFYGPIFQF